MSSRRKNDSWNQQIEEQFIIEWLEHNENDKELWLNINEKEFELIQNLPFVIYRRLKIVNSLFKVEYYHASGLFVAASLVHPDERGVFTMRQFEYRDIVGRYTGLIWNKNFFNAYLGTPITPFLNKQRYVFGYSNNSYMDPTDFIGNLYDIRVTENIMPLVNEPPVFDVANCRSLPQHNSKEISFIACSHIKPFQEIYIRYDSIEATTDDLDNTTISDLESEREVEALPVHKKRGRKRKDERESSKGGKTNKSGISMAEETGQKFFFHENTVNFEAAINPDETGYTARNYVVGAGCGADRIEKQMTRIVDFKEIQARQAVNERLEFDEKTLERTNILEFVKQHQSDVAYYLKPILIQNPQSTKDDYYFVWNELKLLQVNNNLDLDIEQTSSRHKTFGVFNTRELPKNTFIPILGLPLSEKLFKERLETKGEQYLFDVHSGWLDLDPRYQPYQGVGGRGVFIAGLIRLSQEGKSRDNQPNVRLLAEGFYRTTRNVKRGEELLAWSNDRSIRIFAEAERHEIASYEEESESDKEQMFHPRNRLENLNDSRNINDSSYIASQSYPSYPSHNRRREFLQISPVRNSPRSYAAAPSYNLNNNNNTFTDMSRISPLHSQMYHSPIRHQQYPQTNYISPMRNQYQYQLSPLRNSQSFNRNEYRI